MCASAGETPTQTTVVEFVCSRKERFRSKLFFCYPCVAYLLCTTPQAISLELLALYSRPVKMLDTLEKEVSALREKLAKKVEIKEINLKKIASISECFTILTCHTQISPSLP